MFRHVQVRRKVKTEESPRIRPSDLRNFITMFVVFVLFAICWAPLNLIGLAVAIDPTRVGPRIPEWLFVVSYFMAYFNSCLNAIIYGLLNRNFRNEYKRIVTSVWVTRLFVTETSRAATDGRSMRSKQSLPPPLNNNESVRDRANKEWKRDSLTSQVVIPVFMWYPERCAAKRVKSSIWNWKTWLCFLFYKRDTSNSKNFVCVFWKLSEGCGFKVSVTLYSVKKGGCFFFKLLFTLTQQTL